MTRDGGGLFGHHTSRFLLSLAGLMVSIGSVLLWGPVLTISQKGPDTISVYISVSIYVYLTLLIPINFYLNLLLLLLHATAHDRVPRAPILCFVLKYLPSAAQTASFVTLVLSAFLFVHAAVSEESIGFKAGAALACLSLISIVSSVLRKLLNSGGFVPALFSVCIFTGFLISLDPLLPFSNKYDPITHQIPLHVLLIFVSFLGVVLSITLLILRIGVLAATHVENLVIVALHIAIAILLVSGYMKGSVEVITMVPEHFQAREL